MARPGSLVYRYGYDYRAMDEPPTKPAKPSYPIASVDNALKLLRMVGERRWIRVSEASAELGVVRSTAHRLFAMLQYHGFVAQDSETKVYFAGPVLTDIGLAAVKQIDIRVALRPLLESLAAEFQETVQLVTLRGNEIQFLDCVESPRVLRTSSRVGVALPAHCTAAGKALLAELSPEQMRDLYRTSQLERSTPGSVATLEELEAELTKVRKHGYAVQFGEIEPDIAAVAVVVPGNGRARSSMTISAPSSRLSKPNAAKLGKELIATIDRAAAESTTPELDPRARG